MGTGLLNGDTEGFCLSVYFSLKKKQFGIGVAFNIFTNIAIDIVAESLLPCRLFIHYLVICTQGEGV